MPINWPSYEVDISDQFQIHVFTLPAKIQLEIVIKDAVQDRLDLVIPGGHVKSLTSASRLIKEYEFSRRQFYIEDRASKGDETLTRAEKGEAAYQRELEKVEAMELDGSIFVKAEWEGYGEHMPPARSETLFQMNSLGKNRYPCGEQERVNLLQDQKAVDVNDPRYEEVLRALRLMENDYQKKLLAEDAKFQLHDSDSFR